MSNVYELEPPTRGRVQLRTCAGALDVELWPREAPRACRNFVQLCLEGYYDGSSFHRVVKDFLVQGGDPTGTGRGGASVFGGEPFADELHSRLQFRRRGLVACAGAGRADSNGSQFFVTLGRCDHLNKKHTIFGSVTGDSLYNLLRLGERETDAEDHPTDPPRILGASVVENPFDDIQPRPRGEQVGRPLHPEEGAGEAGDAAKTGKGKVSKRPKAKEKLPDRLRMNMLSFGDDEEYEGYEEQARAAGKGVPEEAAGVVGEESGAKAPGKRAGVAPPLGAPESGAPPGPEKGPEVKDRQAAAAAAAGDFGARMREQVLEKKRRVEKPTPEAHAGANASGGVGPGQRPGLGPGREQAGGDERLRGSQPNLLRLKRPRTGPPPAALPGDKACRRKRTGIARRGDCIIARLRRAGGGGLAPGAAPGVAEPVAGEVDRMDLPAAWRVDDYLDIEDKAEDKVRGVSSLRAHVLTFAEKPRRPGEPSPGGDDWDDYEVIDPLLEKGKEAWKRRQRGGQREERKSGGHHHRHHHRGHRGERDGGGSSRNRDQYRQRGREGGSVRRHP